MGERRLSELSFRALGGQPGFDPNDIERFVDARRIGVLAYRRRDGRPNQTPIWYTYRDGVLHMTTTTGSPKHRALERHPEVSLTIQDERPPYRAVIIDALAHLSPLDPADDPTAGMSVRYFGRVGAATYDKLTREIYERSGLTLITLEPVELKGFDNFRALSATERAFVRVRERLPIPRRWL